MNKYQALSQTLSWLLHPFILPVYMVVLVLTLTPFALYPLKMKFYLTWVVALYTLVIPVLSLGVLRRVGYLKEMKSAVIGPWKWGNDFRRMITISPNEGLKSNLEIMNSQNYGFVVITDDMIGKEIDLMESSVNASFNAVGGANSGIPSSLSGQISSGRMLVNVDDNGFTMEMDFLVTDLGETVKIRVSGIHQEPEAKSDAIILGREGFGLSKSAMIDRDGVIEIYLSNANLANLDQFLEENTHPYVKVSFDASLIGTAIDLRSAGANNSVQFANYGNELDDIAGFAGWTSATLTIEDSTDYSDNKIYKVSFDGVDADGKALFVRGSCIYENAPEE